MKCKVCGAYNKSEYKKCIRCGNPLLSSDEEKKQEKILVEHQSPLKNTPTFREALIVEEKSEEKVEKDIRPGTHDDIPDEVDLWTGTEKKSRFLARKKKHVPVLSIKDESAGKKEEKPDKEQDTSPTRRFSRPPSGSNLEKLSKIREGQEVEVLLPPEEKIKKKKAKEKKKRKLKWGRLILVSSVAGINRYRPYSRVLLSFPRDFLGCRQPFRRTRGAAQRRQAPGRAHNDKRPDLAPDNLLRRGRRARAGGRPHTLAFHTGQQGRTFAGRLVFYPRGRHSGRCYGICDSGSFRLAFFH